MKKAPVIFLILSAAFVLLMSLPWLVPHMGWTALLGLVPLLVMERLATEYKVKHFWWIQYACFVLWNAVTTWWVGGATVGGAVFAILANALQMSVVLRQFPLGETAHERGASVSFPRRRLDSLGAVLSHRRRDFLALAGIWQRLCRYYRPGAVVLGAGHPGRFALGVGK